MDETKKIVLDTNVIISGFGWKGNPHRILAKIMNGKFNWVISEKQLDEVKRVVQYPHLKFTEKHREDLFAMISKAATVIPIKTRTEIITEDPSDNMLLDIALAAEAEYLISGDKHLLKIKKIGKTHILKPAAFLKETLP